MKPSVTYAFYEYIQAHVSEEIADIIFAAIDYPFDILSASVMDAINEVAAKEH